MALIRSYDLSDFCNSPPVDGFYYPRQHSGINAGVAGKGNCAVDPNKKKEETRNCTVMGGVMSINQPHQPMGQLSRALSNPSMYQAAGVDTLGGCRSITGDEVSSVPDYLKPVVSGVSGFSSSAFSKQLSLGLTNQQSVTDSPTSSDDGKDAQSSPEEVRAWTSANDRGELDGTVLNHPTDDSAPTPVDHIVSTRFTPTVSRRAGNPFFTGGTEDNSSGSSTGSSWLFRPGKKAGDGNTLHPDKLYEAKIEYQQQPNSKIAKKTVRYVPRPSELRELNFWSPTSM